ncbi:DNA polymerase Y family protein [Proteobacteria bacterium 005FR1]|nr:DNA polymerase Y family protein [Proteobacteria bacterium 005FR1]
MARHHPQPLWLSLHFHSLPLDQLNAGDSVLAIAEKQRIAFATDAAAAAGIYPGMRIGTAYALHPDIKIVERTPAREADALQALSEWCYQFTPTVIPYKKDCLLLEIGGSLTLFRGISRLRQQIAQGLDQQGYHFHEGLAHTKEAAWLFSQVRRDYPDAPLSAREMNEFSAPEPDFWLPQLQALPLQYLDTAAKAKQQLFNMGFGSLGDLLALPRQEVGQRFGRDLLQSLTAIVGEPARLDADFKPAQTFAAQVDFANGLSKVDELIEPMKELLGELMTFLHRQQLYTQGLEWQFYYFRLPCDRLHIHTSPANNNLDSLLSLSKLKLEQYILKAPLESLGLSSSVFTAANAGSGELFPELSSPSNQLRDYRQLLDKLLTRLGDGQLKTLSLGDEHLPEYQHVASELVQQNIEDIRLPKQAANGSEQQRHLPLWLTNKPVPIAAPTAAAGPLRLVYGPQRVDSHWWKERSRRDYFIARHQNGSYCWVYQDLGNQRWFLQGFYG